MPPSSGAAAPHPSTESFGVGLSLVLPQRIQTVSLAADAADKWPHSRARLTSPARLQWKFYAFFVAIPVVYLVAQDVNGATPDNPPYLTRFITQFLGPRNQQWEARNERFMDLVEQAAFDRALFQHADRAQNIEVRSPG